MMANAWTDLMQQQAQMYRLQTSKTSERILGRVRQLEQGNLRLRRGELGPITGPYSKISNGFFDSTGNIDTTKSGVRKRGSVPPSNNTTGFAYTATTTSITWYWDGTNGSSRIILRRADNTVQVIPAGSITITGLVAATEYNFLPFWAPDNQCTIGWVVGTHGSPQIAFLDADMLDANIGPAAANQQALQDREPLSAGAMTASTPAAGTGGGGAGGGGAGGSGCVMAGTDIQPLGDHNFAVEVLPETDWVRIVVDDQRTLSCTLDHPLYHSSKGKTEAKDVVIGDKLLMDDGEHEVIETHRFKRCCSKRKVVMGIGHIFFANGFMSHNAKYSQK